MESEELEAQIDKYMNEVSKFNLKNLDKLEKLLLREFQENADETDFSIWTDCFRAQIEDIDLKLLGDERFRRFLINVGIVDTHIVCGPFYGEDIDGKFNSEELDEIADLPLCEEDSGRSDSCFGAHFFISLQANISEKTLKKLLKIEHYDEGFFPWLVARSTSASASLLTKIANEYTNTTTWRVEGEHKEGFGLITSTAETFVLWNVFNNPKTSAETLLKFQNEIKNLKESTEEELLAQLEKTKRNYYQESIDKLKQFDGETSYLDSDFLKWIDRFYNSTPLFEQDLFEDDLEELENEKDENFKKLVSLWLALSDRTFIGVSEEKARWELVGARLPIELRKIEGAPPSFIDLLYGEALTPAARGLFGRNKQDIPTGRWKISIVRTGAIDEYVNAELKEELAWKMWVVADGQGVELSKVVGEVIWARSQEFTYPLSEYLPDLIEAFAQTYIQKWNQ
jgi:hypothetical protein